MSRKAREAGDGALGRGRKGLRRIVNQTREDRVWKGAKNGGKRGTEKSLEVQGLMPWGTS